MELKDSTLSDKEISIPLYYYFFERSPTVRTSGKFEHFITDLEDVGFGGRMQDPVVYHEVAKAFAQPE